MAFRKFSFDHDVLVDFLGKDTTEKCVELKVVLFSPFYICLLIPYLVQHGLVVESVIFCRVILSWWINLFQLTFFQVLALKGSYHGDTLGAMEAQAPSPYTGFLQQPWYRCFVPIKIPENYHLHIKNSWLFEDKVFILMFYLNIRLKKIIYLIIDV